MWRSFFAHVQPYSENRFQEVKNMKKLLICCLFGNTANSLAKKMQVQADSSGHPLMISAVGLDNFASVAPAFDGFLIAPHIQYKLSEIYEIVGNARPVAIIESLPYASLDAEKVLHFVKENMPELAA
jgi:PTS system cellobiose-specific IIB component